LTLETLLRPMELQDVDSVLAIASAQPLAPQWSRQSYVRALDPQGFPLRIALVAEAEGAIAGFAVSSVVALQAELESIAVAAANQGRGVGQTLLAAMLSAVGQAGAEEIILEVRVSNQRAIQLYRKEGFLETGVRRDYYQSPVEDAFLMRRTIP
jgi:ribosomal-protein-alanine N-acetyltransferase